MTPDSPVLQPSEKRGRWRTYLRERFPLQAHGPLVLAFAGGVVCATAAMAGTGWPAFSTVALVFVTVLGFFFQLRVADEWKDAETDRLHRPERPVPRGLVSLRELTGIALVVANVQLALTVVIGPELLVPLLLVWVFGVLMTFEFFARDWLRTRAFATLASHGLIVPLIAFYAASAAALVGGLALPRPIAWLLGASFFAGNVVEIGRKLWAPADERAGVETYSGAWGPRLGALVFGGAAVLSCVCAAATWLAVPTLGQNPIAVGIVSAFLVTPVLVIAARYASNPSEKSARAVEAAAAVWTLGVYVVLGPLALLASA